MTTSTGGAGLGTGFGAGLSTCFTMIVSYLTAGLLGFFCVCAAVVRKSDRQIDKGIISFIQNDLDVQDLVARVREMAGF